jgi:UDP-glucose 4-epimerase
MRIFLTGGAGYIGSHAALAVLDAGHEPVLLDNFSNSVPEVADRLGAIAGRRLSIIKGDVRDKGLVRAALSGEGIDAVIHLAASKAVAESVADPLAYYANNVGGTLTVLEAMEAEGVRNFVFSSSAAVYGEPQRLPMDEDHPTQPVSPYGQTKLICENILSDLVRADRGWRASILRYFNPVGAHSSGVIGEDPTGVPNNLMPLIVRAALGQADHLDVYGTDYPTPDGTAVRDYIHVVDLAQAHIVALEALGKGEALQLYNLGTGHGTSVAQLIDAFEQATGTKVPYVAADRRPGDAAAMYAAVRKAEQELGWRATLDLPEMCSDSWRFATRFR